MTAEVFLHIAHHPQRELGGEDAGVLRLVFLEDVRLHGAAHQRERLGDEPRVLGLRKTVPDHHPGVQPEQREPGAVVPLGQFAAIGAGRHRARAVEGTQFSDAGSRLRPASLSLEEALHALVDRGVHEHREQHRRRAVDRHRDRGRGRAQIEARVELLHVIERSDGDTRIAGAAVDVGPGVRILAVERGRVERRREPSELLTSREIMEAPVGALRRTLAGEHADRVLLLAAIRIDARGVGIGTRQVLQQQEAQRLAPIAERGRDDLRDAVAAQRLGEVGAAQLAPADLVGVLVGANRCGALRPLAQRGDPLGADRCHRAIVTRAQRHHRTVRRAAGRSRGRCRAIGVERRRQRRITELTQ